MALGPEILTVAARSPVLVDGSLGEVVINPDAEDLSSFTTLSERNSLRQSLAASAAAQPAITRDGVAVEVVANIGGLEDAEAAVSLWCAEGVGLFRT